MSTVNPWIGRREGIGIGIEATPGTAVAPQAFMKWLDQDLQNKTTVVENESALGVVEKINDSAVANVWSEGTINGKVTADTVGYLLLGIFGTVSTGTATAGVYPHTFSVNQSSLPKTLTFTHVTPIKTERYSYGVVESLELNAETGDWVTVEAAVKSRKGASSSDTIALASEAEFTSKDITVKKAANVAGLASATALPLRSTKLTLTRESEKFDALGTSDTPEFDRGAFEAKGEFVIRYTDTDYEDAFLNNTVSAMEIKLANGDDTLTFTASKVRYRELEKSSDKDEIVTQTISFYCEFDDTTSKAIEAVLNNTVTSYVAA